jgi:hypothetical protein
MRTSKGSYDDLICATASRTQRSTSLETEIIVRRQAFFPVGRYDFPHQIVSNREQTANGTHCKLTPAMAIVLSYLREVVTFK